jgi:hypothetical protein
LTRKITRKQALSYEKTVPNARGVTALVEVNGPDAYRRRYEATKKVLSAGDRKARRNAEETTMAKYTAGQTKAMAKMTPNRRAAFKKMLANSPDITAIRPNAKKRSRRKAKPNRALVPSAAEQAAFERGFGKAFPKKKRKAAPKKKATAKKKGRPTKASFVAAQERSGRTPKQAQAAWNLAYGKHSRGAKKAKKRSQTRTYGKGKYRALKAKVGSTSRQTYMYRTPKGSVRHIPEHAVLGYKSPREMNILRQTAKGSRSYDARLSRLRARRDREAEKAAAQIRAGRGIFTPNPGGEVLSFEEWKDMKSNKATRKKTGWTKAKRKAAAKKAAATRKRNAARKAAPKKRATKKRTTKRAAVKRPTKAAFVKKLTRKRPGKKKLTAKQANALWNNLYGKGKAAPKKRKAAPKKRKAAPKRRKTTSRAKSMTITMRANASPAQLRAARRNIKKAQAARYRNNSEMRYEANAAEAYVSDLRGALALGAVVVTGYMAHRALSKVVADMGLAKFAAFQEGSLLKWRDTIASMLVAAVGIPVSIKYAPKYSAAASAGIATSLLQNVIVKALTEMGQGEAVSYLSNYPNASSKAYPGLGSYYTFQPRQIYPAAGVGEYYSLGPGQLTTGELTAAAAGFQPMQASAGMGALVTQAAAGEYLVYGAEGVGDNYEEIPTANMAVQIDEGVAPNLYSAEQALNVMEAAAGVGMAEIPLQSTVNPLQMENPIGDEPRGSRSGVFQGGGGIFG